MEDAGVKWWMDGGEVYALHQDGRLRLLMEDAGVKWWMDGGEVYALHQDAPACSGLPYPISPLSDSKHAYHGVFELEQESR